MSLHRSIFLLVFFLLLPPGCASVWKNYEGDRPDSEVGVLRSQGYQFRLQDDAPPRRVRPADELRLLPGEYIIRFVHTTYRNGGAALCVIEAGRRYTLKVSGRQFVSESGSFAFTGECVPEDES